MKRRIVSALLLLILSTGISNAQAGLNRNVPQVFSPNAAEMGRYGRVPVNYFNGLPNVTVPLTELKAAGYSLPVYLSYHASGNKPENHPGWAGQGWYLHAGGSINRVINGDKDELSSEEYVYRNNGGINPRNDPGYLFHAVQTQKETPWQNADTLAALAHPYLVDITDYEPDEFHVNIEGINASFYITGENEVKIVSKGDDSFDVEYELSAVAAENDPIVVMPSPTNSLYDLKAGRFTYFKSFIIKDREGNRYFFGGDDSAIEYSVKAYPSYRVESTYPININNWRAIATANTWHLSKIERANGEVITFSYKRDGTPIVLKELNYGELYNVDTGNADPGNAYAYETRNDNIYKSYLHFNFLLPSYLTSIEASVSGDYLNFSSSATNELAYEIDEDDFYFKIGQFQKNITGTYSFDDWQSRNYYLRLTGIQGVGRNIVLTHTNNADTRLKLLSVKFMDENNVENHSYSFEYNSTALPGYNSKKTDKWGYFNNVSFADSYGFFGINLENVRVPDATAMQAEILTSIIYPTGGRTTFVYEPHYYSSTATQYPFGLTQHTNSFMAGGLRIKEIQNHVGGKVEKRTFSYTRENSTLSSGILSGTPKLYVEGHRRVAYWKIVNGHAVGDTLGSYNTNYKIYSDNPIQQLSETDGNHVTYSRITETLGDGSYSVYTYTNHDDSSYMDKMPTASVDNMDGASINNSFNSMELFRGLLLSKEDFDKDGNIVRKEAMNYSRSTSDFVKSVNKARYCAGNLLFFAYVQRYTSHPYLIKKVITTYQDSGGPIVEEQHFTYNNQRRLVSFRREVGDSSEETLMYYPANRTGSGYANMIAGGMSGIPVGTATLLDGKIVSAQEMTYKRIGINGNAGSRTICVPDKLYNSELSAPILKSAYEAAPFTYMGADAEMEFRDYDNNGNISGIYNKGGLSTRYIWDDNSLNPILVANNIETQIYEEKDVSKYATFDFEYPALKQKTVNFSTVAPSELSVSIGSFYGYNWLVYVSVDGNFTNIVSYGINENPIPEVWMNYMTRYNSTATFDLPAGDHTFTMDVIDTRSGSNNLNSNDGYITYYYSEAQMSRSGTSTPIFFYDFEDENESGMAYHSGHGHTGVFNINETIPSNKNYVLDYMMYTPSAGKWTYHRQSYSGGSISVGASGSSIDNVRIFPEDCDINTYSWEPYGGMSSATDSRGITTSYVYDGLGRLVRTADNNGNPLSSYAYNYASQTNEHNNITENVYTNANGTSYRTTISYLDALGRPVQSVLVNGGLGGYDIVSMLEYDQKGRESKQWLPAPVSVDGSREAGEYATLDDILAGGDMVYDAEDEYRYSEHIYDSSPLDRVSKQFGPGEAWRTENNMVKYTYLSNTETSNSDTYHRGFKVSWSGSALTLTRAAASPAASLQIARVSDETGRTVLEFRDMHGRIVLSRRLSHSLTESNLDTYYVYDDFGRLAVVIPPKLVEELGGGTSWIESDISSLAYIYRYDARGNCIAKLIPGGGWRYYVYDKGGRMILSQDASQKSTSKWTFNLSDKLGRPVLTGTTKISGLDAFSEPYKNENVTANLPKNPNYASSSYGYEWGGLSLTSYDLLKINYYDNYNFLGSHGIPASGSADVAYDSSVESEFTPRYGASAHGMATGSVTRILDNADTPSYLWSLQYYDDRGQVVQSRSRTHLGGVEKVFLSYDFTGNVLKKKISHKLSATSSLDELYTYTYDAFGRPLLTLHKIGDDTVKTISNKKYDKIGRLSAELRNGVTRNMSNYSYNIRSWIEEINSQLFMERLFYNDSPYSGSNEWGGNVSAMRWRVETEPMMRGYDFTYDAYSRLTVAGYSENSASANNRFGEFMSYDKNGNIVNIIRRGYDSETSSVVELVNLPLTYSGNRLTKIGDSSVSHDAKGRQRQSRYGSVNIMTYNDIDLPLRYSRQNDLTIDWSYSADGVKLRESSSGPDGNMIRDYVGSLVIENGELKTLLFDGGYVNLSATLPGYYFFHKDHLGNNRVVATTSGAAMQVYHYYPSGEIIEDDESSALVPLSQRTNPYRYGGKEYNFDINQYDFVARQFSPLTGRFTSIDPLAEKYYHLSPYAYCANNPMTYVDKFGEDLVLAGKNGSSVTFTTDLIDFSINLEVLGVDWNGNYTLAGYETLTAALDLAGIVDPSGVTDGVNAVLQAMNGDYWGAASSAVSLLPLGDVVKIGKIDNHIRLISNAIESSSAAARPLRSFTKSNFRENLTRLKGAPNVGEQAHHVLPHKFNDKFERAGIDVNDPKYGVWMDGTRHNKKSYEYNEKWKEFFEDNENPTALDIYSEAKTIMENVYGTTVNYNGMSGFIQP